MYIYILNTASYSILGEFKNAANIDGSIGRYKKK